MATLALPIRDLERSVCIGAEKARAETERVLTYSGTRPADFGTALKVATTTLVLKLLLGQLVRAQSRLISAYARADLNHFRSQDLAELATTLDKIISKDHELLTKANALGAEIRVWWSASLARLAEQVEHLDSIAESLHLAVDSEASALLALAAGELAIK
jgi:hypothetical protein